MKNQSKRIGHKVIGGNLTFCRRERAGERNMERPIIAKKTAKDHMPYEEWKEPRTPRGQVNKRESKI